MKYIKKAFESNWIALLGLNVDIGIKEAVTVSSGTAAIHLALSFCIRCKKGVIEVYLT